MSSVLHYAVYYTQQKWRQKSEVLAQELNCPLFETPQDEEYAVYLVYSEAGLELQMPMTPAFKPLSVDFIHGKNQFRASQSGWKKELIARAVGFKAQYRPRVLDATAGLGRDGVLLARLGCTVCLLERHPVVYALLNDGVQRAQQDAAFARLELTVEHHDARHYLHGPPIVDVIALDPMYPQGSHRALAKKEMRVLRDLVGPDEDSTQLLQLALQHARRRVVVKRPLLAPGIGRAEPDICYKGSSTRFDVYLTAGGERD